MALFDFISSLAPIVGQIIGYNQAQKAVKKYNVPTASEKRSNALYEALLDPNSGLLNSLTQEERFSARESFLSQLRDMQLADRRSQSVGRAPTFFQPERADEAVNFLTSRGLPMLNAIAAQRAQERISGSAAGIRGLMPEQVERNMTAMGAGVSRGATIDAIGRSLGGGQYGNFFDALRGNAQPQYDIYNNPMKRPASTYHNNLGWIDWT